MRGNLLFKSLEDKFDDAIVFVFVFVFHGRGKPTFQKIGELFS